MQGTILIRGGCLLTMDDALGDVVVGDLLIDDDQIVAVAEELDCEAEEVVDATGMIVMPGLVDTHNHLWQAPIRGLAAECWGDEYFPTVHPLSGRIRPGDMRAATYGGAVEALSHGSTTIVDFCHSVNSPDHADASIEGLRQAGIRAIFGYSFRDRPEVDRRSFASPEERYRDAARVADVLQGDPLVSMGIALNNVDHVSEETARDEVVCGKDLDAASMIHSVDSDDIPLFADRGLLHEKLMWVHQESAGPEELELLAEQGGSLSATPEIEIGMSGNFPVVGRAVRRGVPVGLGIDIPSAVNSDLLVQARLAYQAERMFDAHRERLEGRGMKRGPRVPAMTTRDVLRVATIGGARAVGLDDEIGSLTVGKQADILLLRTRPFGMSVKGAASHVITHASAADIESVLVAGQFRVRSGQLVGVDEAGMHDDLMSARQQMLGG